MFNIEASSKVTPTMVTLVSGHTSISSSFINNITFCSFKRTLFVPTNSSQFMYNLETKHHIAIASGSVGSTSLGFHFGSRAITDKPVDITEFPKVYITIYHSVTKDNKSWRNLGVWSVHSVDNSKD